MAQQWSPPATPKEYSPEYLVRVFKRLGKTVVDKKAVTGTGTIAKTDFKGLINDWFHREYEKLKDYEQDTVEKWALKQETYDAYEFNPKNVLSIRTSKDINSVTGRWSVEFDYRYGVIDENNLFIQIEPMDYVEIYMRRKAPEIAEGVPIKDKNGNVVPMGVFKRKVSPFIKYGEAKKTNEFDPVAEAENPIMAGLDNTGQFYPNLQWVGAFDKIAKDRPLTIEEKIDNPDFVICGFVDGIQNNFNISSGEPSNRIILNGKCVGKILEEHNIFFNTVEPMNVPLLQVYNASLPTLTAVKAIDFVLHNFLQSVLDPDAKLLFNTSKSKEYRNNTNWLQATRYEYIFNGDGTADNCTTTIHNAPPMSRFIYWAEDVETRWGRMEEHSSEGIHAIGNISDGSIWSKVQQMSNSNLNEFWVDECGNVVMRLAKNAWNSPSIRTTRVDTVYQLTEKEQIVDMMVGSLSGVVVVINPDFGDSLANSDGAAASYKNINVSGQIFPYTESEFNLRISQTLQRKLELERCIPILINTKDKNLTPDERISQSKFYTPSVGPTQSTYVPLSQSTGQEAWAKDAKPLIYITISTSNMNFSNLLKNFPGFMICQTSVGNKNEDLLADDIKVALSEDLGIMNSGIVITAKEDILQYRSVPGYVEVKKSYEHTVGKNAEAGAIIVRPINIIPLPAEDDTPFFIDGYGNVNQFWIDRIADAIIKGLKTYRNRAGHADNVIVPTPTKVMVSSPVRVKRHWGGDHIFINTKDIHGWSFTKSDDDLKTLVQTLPVASVMATQLRGTGNFGQVPLPSNLYELTISAIQSQITDLNASIQTTKTSKLASSKAAVKQKQDDLAKLNQELDQVQKQLWRLRSEQQLNHFGSYSFTARKIQDMKSTINTINQYRTELTTQKNEKRRQEIIKKVIDLEHTLDFDRPIKAFWNRFGIRPVSIPDIFNWKTSDLIDSASTMFQYFGNQWWTGTITVKGDARYKIGRIIEIPELSLTFYCTGVDHAFTWGEGWQTNLKVTRGDLANSPYDIRKHLAVEKQI